MATRPNVNTQNPSDYKANIDAAIAELYGIAQKNALLNGDANIWQQTNVINAGSTPANNDDTYFTDGWILLSDGNDIVDIYQDQGDFPDKSFNSFRFDVQTANKKFGMLQIIPYEDVAKFKDQVASISFQAKVGTGDTIGKIGFGVASWSSTADSPTSDIVSAWNAAGNAITLVSNWTWEGSSLDQPVTDSWQEFKLENINIDTTNTANIAVFIWCDDLTTTVGDQLSVAQVQLVPGETITGWNPRTYDEELARAQYFYYKTQIAWTYYSPTTATFRNSISFPEMRAVPSVTITNSVGTTISVNVGTTYWEYANNDTTSGAKVLRAGVEFDARL